MPRSLSDLFERGKPVGAWSLVAPLDKNLAAPLWVAHAGPRVAYVRSFRVRSLRTAERLKQVVDWAAAYEHNSILPHLDLLELEGGGGYAVVSHYEEGHLLAPMLAKANLARKPVPPAVAAQIAIDLLDALVATGGRLAPSWAQGGLRPESVLITRGGRARLMELGAAGVMAAVDPLARDVRWAAYASPEQTETGKPGPNSDVFTLAALLWEMLVNRPAFEGRGYAEVKPKLLGAEVERADRRAKERVPTALADVIAQGLAQEPEERFETPKAFAGAIRAASRSVAQRVEVADYLERLHQAALNVRRRNLEQALGRPAPTSIPPPPSEAPRFAAGQLSPKAPRLPSLGSTGPPSSRPPPSSQHPPPASRPPASKRKTARQFPAIAPPPKSAPRPDSARPPRSKRPLESSPPPRANVLPPDPLPLTRRADEPSPSDAPAESPPPAAAATETPSSPPAPQPPPAADSEPATAPEEAADKPAAPPSEPSAPSAPTAPAETGSAPAADDERDSDEAAHEPTPPAASSPEADEPAQAEPAGEPAGAAPAPEPVGTEEPASASETDAKTPEPCPSAPAAAPSVEVAIDLDDDAPSEGGLDPAAATAPDPNEPPVSDAGLAGDDATPAEPAAAAPSAAPTAAPASFDPDALLGDTGLDDMVMRPPRRWPGVLAGMVIGSVITLALVYGTGGPGGDSCADAGVVDAAPTTANPTPTPPAEPEESSAPEPSAAPTASASASATAETKVKGKPPRPRPRPKPKPKATAAPPAPPPPAPPEADIYD